MREWHVQGGGFEYLRAAGCSRQNGLWAERRACGENRGRPFWSQREFEEEKNKLEEKMREIQRWEVLLERAETGEEKWIEQWAWEERVCGWKRREKKERVADSLMKERGVAWSYRLLEGEESLEGAGKGSILKQREVVGAERKRDLRGALAGHRWVLLGEG